MKITIYSWSIGGWQSRVAILDRRDAHNGRAGDDRRTVTAGDGALPVSVPFGRLPVDVPGRDALPAELNTSLGGPWRRRRPRVWILAGLGGMDKSTLALRVGAETRGRGRPVWWVNAADPLSLRGGVLESLRLMGAPDAVARAVRHGSPTAADQFWTFLDGAVKRAVLIFDNADQPTGLAADGVSLPGAGTGWVRPSRGVHMLVTTRTDDPGSWGSWTRMRVLTALDDLSAADVLRRLAPRVRTQDRTLRRSPDTRPACACPCLPTREALDQYGSSEGEIPTWRSTSAAVDQVPYLTALLMPLGVQLVGTQGSLSVDAGTFCRRRGPQGRTTHISTGNPGTPRTT